MIQSEIQQALQEILLPYSNYLSRDDYQRLYVSLFQYIFTMYKKGMK